jgi:DNA-directed RNA polymerase specialized sigma24 family protein
MRIDVGGCVELDVAAPVTEDWVTARSAGCEGDRRAAYSGQHGGEQSDGCSATGKALGADHVDSSQVAVITAPRQRSAVLTHDGPSDIGAVWCDLSPRLRGYLMRLGCSRDLAEDLVQDVALRALRTRIRFTDTEDLLRWCNVVGRNLYVDHVRSISRRPQEALADDFDRASADDLETTVEHRLQLTSVLRGVGLLSRNDRLALFTPLMDEDVEPVSRTEATRLAVRRHRARGRLRAVLKTAVVLLGGCWTQLRSWLRPGPSVALALTGVSFLVVSVLPSTAPETTASAPAKTTQAVVQAAETHALRMPRSRASNALRRRVSTPVAAASPQPDVSVELADTGFGARSGTSARKGRELACVGLTQGRDDVCVMQPGVRTGSH